MALFGFGKKKDDTQTCCNDAQPKNSCACAGACTGNDAQESRILVLGACCQKSADTVANVKQAAAELGLTDEVCNIGDAMEIAKYGVMQTPALVIDSKVCAYGKLIKVPEAKKLIEQAGLVP